MSLTTGRQLSRRQWMVLPMPNSVIAAIEAHAESEKQPLIEGGCPKFEWRPNLPITDDSAATALDVLATAADKWANIGPVFPEDFMETEGADTILNEPAEQDADALVDYGPQHPLHLPVDDEPLKLIKDEHAPIPAELAEADVVVPPSNVHRHDDAPAQPHNAVSDDDVSTAIPDDSLNELQERALFDDAADFQERAVLDMGEEHPDDEPNQHDDSDADRPFDEEESMDTPTDTQATNLNGEEADPLPPRYNLWPVRDRSYSHRLASHMNASSGTKSYDPHIQLLQFTSNNMETCPGDMFFYIFGFMTTQMMALRGIKNMARKPWMHCSANFVDWITKLCLSQWMLPS